MQTIFVQIRCKPGTTFDVADEICLKEIHSEMYSISGEYDLWIKLYLEDDVDIGRFVNTHIGSVKNVERTTTTPTFSAF